MAGLIWSRAAGLIWSRAAGLIWSLARGPRLARGPHLTCGPWLARGPRPTSGPRRRQLRTRHPLLGHAGIQARLVRCGQPPARAVRAWRVASAVVPRTMEGEDA